jgi:probable HAF family extracellular repeat protein
MKSNSLVTTSIFGLLALLAVPAGLSAQEQATTQARKLPAPRFTVIDLGTLGGAYSDAYGINDAGEVAGGAATPAQTNGIAQTAFLWKKGKMINLGTLGGSACPQCSSEAGGPNAGGELALISETALTDPNGEDFCGFGTHLQCLAAIWKKGAMTALRNLPGGHNSQAYAINNEGQVVGLAENGIFDSTCIVPSQVIRYQAALWEPNGYVRELAQLPGDTVSFAFDVNDEGEVVGVSGLCSNVSLPPNATPSGPHAVLWGKDGAVTNLGGLPGGVSNIAGSINNRGEVVGTSALSDGTVHTWQWTRKTGMKDIGSLPGAVVTVTPCCGSLNDSGEAVGFSVDGATGNLSAFVWQRGVLTDLNSLIPPNSPLYLMMAQVINSRGEIAGVGLTNAGEIHAFLAKPD